MIQKQDDLLETKLSKFFRYHVQLFTDGCISMKIQSPSGNMEVKYILLTIR